MMIRNFAAAAMLAAFVAPAAAQDPLRLYPPPADRGAPDAAAPQAPAPQAPAPQPADPQPAAPLPPPPQATRWPPPQPGPDGPVRGVPGPGALPVPENAPSRAPDDVPDEPFGGPAAVVRSFYEALGRADGVAANRYVVPEKRDTGSYGIRSIERFWSEMREPLRVLDVERREEDLVRVRYAYTHISGRRCNGAADVRLSMASGQPLVAGIRPLNGC